MASCKNSQGREILKVLKNPLQQGKAAQEQWLGPEAGKFGWLIHHVGFT